LEIKVGLEVDFKKSTLLKSQIRSGTISETKNVHHRMFDAVKRVCQSSDDPAGLDRDVGASDGGIEDVEEEETSQGGFFSLIRSSMSMIPINPNFVMFTFATFAYPVLWNFFSARFGAPSLSVHEAHSLNMEMKELREEVRALRSSLETALKLLEKGN